MTGTISGALMHHARLAYNMCVQDGTSRKIYKEKDNNYSTSAIIVYILSVAAIESFLNEVSYIYQHWKSTDEAKRKYEQLMMIERIRDKCYELPKLLWDKRVTKGTRPYQDFYMLVEIRNDIIHYDMTISNKTEGLKYLTFLKGRRLLLGNSQSSYFGFTVLDQLFSTRAAKWAYNTACKMVKKLIELGQEETHSFIKGNLADLGKNFQEIP